MTSFYGDSVIHNPLKRQARDLARDLTKIYIANFLRNLGWDGMHSTEDAYLAALDSMKPMLLVVEDAAASIIEQRLYGMQKERR